MSALPKPNNVWKLAEAKNKLSEVVNRTLSEGPQEIHRRNDVVIVIRKDEFNALADAGKRPTLAEHLLSIPRDVPGEPSLTDVILEGRKGEYDH